MNWAFQFCGSQQMCVKSEWFIICAKPAADSAKRLRIQMRNNLLPKVHSLDIHFITTYNNTVMHYVRTIR